MFSCRRALSHVMSDCSGCFPPGRRHGKRLTMPPPPLLYALCPETRCRQIHSCFSRVSFFSENAHCHSNQMDSHYIVEVSLQLTTCLFAEGGSALSEPSSTTACLVPAPLTYYTRVLMYHFPLLIHNALHITRYSPITHSSALPVR